MGLFIIEEDHAFEKKNNNKADSECQVWLEERLPGNSEKATVL